jgi:hypothetical protein
MSFVGDLEHLPIVDVIQLLHATRKSGTLCLRSSKGESQLVFSDGCIVSANHSNNSVRIGQILVEMNAISREELDRTLAEQKNAGAKRIPLIAALIESGKIKKESAFKGLETLIEMTIVEVLTWTEGTFELDVDTNIVSDEYRYIPENLKLDLNLNTQNVLMDALRIYDEKKRDGTLMDETFPANDAQQDFGPEQVAEDQIISIDDLGLDVLDDLEKLIPGFFTPAKAHDPSQIHREKIGSDLADLPEIEQQKLISFLTNISSDQPSPSQPAPTQAIILFSGSEFLRHTIMTVCKHEGFFSFATDEEENLDTIINQSLARELHPVFLIDTPDKSNDIAAREKIATVVKRLLEKHPDISIFQLVQPGDFESALNAIKGGARATLPKPDKVDRKNTFIDDTIIFLDTLKHSVRVAPPMAAGENLPLFRACIDEMSKVKELPAISMVLERFISGTMQRSLTLTLRKTDLVTDRLLDGDTVQPLDITINADGIPAIMDVLASGKPCYGPMDDQLFKDSLYGKIDPPLSRNTILLPLKCLGRVLAIVYGDFGSKSGSAMPLQLAEILSMHAGLVYENALYRKKFEKMIQSQH